MAGNRQLARQCNDKIVTAPTQLKPQEKCLLVELALAAENAKTELSPELQAEFLQEFGSVDSKELQAAFRKWRSQSPFMPTISEINQILGQAQYELLSAENDRRHQEALDRWLNAPPKKQPKTLGPDAGIPAKSIARAK